jgi:hypothetical protein
MPVPSATKTRMSRPSWIPADVDMPNSDAPPAPATDKTGTHTKGSMDFPR